MAEWMPAGIGLMVGVGLYTWLSWLDGRRIESTEPGVPVGIAQPGAVRALRAALLEGARRLGAAVPMEVARNRRVRACVDEWTRLPLIKRLAEDGAGPIAAFGQHGSLGSADAAYRADALHKDDAQARQDVLLHSGLDYEARLGSLLIADVLCGVLGCVVASSPWGLPVGIGAPWLLLALRAARRAQAETQRIEAAMPEAFAALAIALGSGHTLAQGMRFVGSHAQEPVRSEFMRVAYAITCGVPATAALDSLLERLPAPGLGLVSLALKVSQRTGAPLRGLLTEAADMVGERIELARRLDVKTSQARMSARLVALMPLAMVAMLTLLSPDFRAGLATPVGMGSVVVALVLNLIAWGIIRRMMDVNVE